MPTHTIISMIVAVCEKTLVIGNDGEIPWGRLPQDLKHFKEKTMGHPVIMGRKTWESLPLKHRPLEGRTNIVVSRNVLYEAQGATVVSSFNNALIHAYGVGTDEIFLIGGASLYEWGMIMCDKMYCTVVRGQYEGDVRLNSEYKEIFRKLMKSETFDHNGISFLIQERFK
jgi:dihydrofolate reductase